MNYFQTLDFYQKLLEKCESANAFVVVSLVGVRGSAPQDLGAKMLVSLDGVELGTVGGGKVENAAIEFAKNLIQDQASTPVLKKWNLQKDIGMTCGGEVELLFEPIGEKNIWEVVIFGAGHVSQALVRILLTLNLKLTVIDQRKEWLDKLPCNRKLTTIEHSNPCELVKKLSDNSFVISLTMGHAFDIPILVQALKHQSFPYLGVIGSKVKRAQIEKDLKELGVSVDKLESLICPLGEKIGSNQPEEIAISIIAELLKKRDELFKTL